MRLFLRLLLYCCYSFIRKLVLYACRFTYVILSLFVRGQFYSYRKLYFSVYRWGTITAICFLPATDIPINIKTAHPRRRDPASGVAFTARFGSKYITYMSVFGLWYIWESKGIIVRSLSAFDFLISSLFLYSHLILSEI